MFHATIRAAIEGACTLARLDDLSRQVWQAVGAELVDDGEAQQLAEFLEGRRRAMRDRIVPVGIPAGRNTLFPPRRYQRARDRAASRQRRRDLACLHPLPMPLAARFTEGQRAVLKIVADEVREKGLCALPIDAIAARAGVCRRLAQGALRFAHGDGLLTIEERRREGRKNDTNVIRIISREWLAWIKRGRSAPPPSLGLAGAGAPPGSPIGCKAIHRTDKGVQTGDDKDKRSGRAATPHSVTNRPGTRAGRGSRTRI